MGGMWAAWWHCTGDSVGAAHHSSLSASKTGVVKKWQQTNFLEVIGDFLPSLITRETFFVGKAENGHLYYLWGRPQSADQCEGWVWGQATSDLSQAFAGPGPGSQETGHATPGRSRSKLPEYILVWALLSENWPSGKISLSQGVGSGQPCQPRSYSVTSESIWNRLGTTKSRNLIARGDRKLSNQNELNNSASGIAIFTFFCWIQPMKGSLQ